jgi:hyperosmotically inducible protein
MTALGRTAAAVILAASLAACSSMTGRTAGQTVDDATISTSVKANLAREKAKSLTAIDVDTVNGVVYLTGMVSDATTKERAADIARETDGVVRVVNNLQTHRAPAGDAPAHRR